MSDQRPPGLLEAVIAAARTRNSWNQRFQHWERPASDSEESQIQRSAAMVGAALKTNNWLAQEGVQIRPQGSYHNNTNVRKDSDMDLCAWHPGIQVMVEPGLSAQEVRRWHGYTLTGHQIPDIAAELRRQVHVALVASFGKSNVHCGNVAFRVSAVPGSRTDVDVVPAVQLHYVRRGKGLFDATERVNEGVIIYALDGSQIMNFPRQHHENGKAKRARTAHRFKKVVRTAKRLRDELVGIGNLRPGQVPSFLVESLIYGVEDDVFLHDEDDRYGRMREVLLRLEAQSRDPLWQVTACEINGIKPLFWPGQPWSVADTQAFIASALHWVRV